MNKHYYIEDGKTIIPITHEKFADIDRVGRFLATLIVEGTKYMMKFNIRSKEDVSVCCPLCDEPTTMLYMKPFDFSPEQNNIPYCKECFGKSELPAK
ncbi:hypothetical protein ACMGE5_10185 [Macrococcus equi]|uniref:hypothetical protein n=1 Tax=Macrococcus equi TaxID=3395462 RepID=UPI0039BE7DC4